MAQPQQQLLPLTMKRLMADVKALQKDPPEFTDAFPDESNMLIWYFGIRGTDDYAGGFYIGKIIHDKEYPLKPPDFQFLTPSGRYEINKNICTTFTRFHPDQWSAIWNIKSLLDGILTNMNDNGDIDGSQLGQIKTSKEERMMLAKESIAYNMKHHKSIFLNFTRFVNSDGTLKTDEEVKMTLKKEKKKKSKDGEKKEDGEKKDE